MAKQNTLLVSYVVFLTLPCVTTKLFEVQSSKGHACTLLDLDFRIIVTASTKESLNEVTSKLLTQNSTITAVGNCRSAGTRRKIVLLFSDSSETVVGQFMHFVFRLRDNEVFLSRKFEFIPHITFPELFPRTSLVKFKDPHVVNLGEIGTSYQCLTTESTSYGQTSRAKDNYIYSVNVEATRIHAQAYFVYDSKFSDATQCTTPRPKNIAQIVVGGIFICFLVTGVAVSVCLHIFCTRYQREIKTDYMDSSSP
ncbi:hypothetical protein ElyMa_001077500 [Elysia marginata]|uniref:Uncharacterized protein n=1 Tax=Elysia marginata TaxID=1093978 RepID=A0AAV4HRC9_9GAST|nr:hypothetical protein ElyMa_001077500 [Elysia marginata]